MATNLRRSGSRRPRRWSGARLSARRCPSSHAERPTHSGNEETEMVDRALVMGGGGIVGIAWETGILKGLLGGGVDPSAADLVIGTSAGATVGAQVAAGADFGDLLAAQLGPIDPRQTQLLAESDREAMAALYALMARSG